MRSLPVRDARKTASTQVVTLGEKALKTGKQESEE